MKRVRTGRLSFGERMSLWRKARREYAEKIKAKLKEKIETEEKYPPQPPEVEGRSLVPDSPTKATEMKPAESTPISKPSNIIESAINRLRERAQGL